MSETNTAVVLSPARNDSFESVAGMAVVPRINSAGKSLGIRMVLTNGGKTAGERRKEGKDAGLKGKELTTYVNAHLSGDEALAARIRFGATMDIAFSKGFVPTVVDANKAGDKLKVELVQPKSAKGEAKTAGKLKTAEKAAAAALAEVKAVEGKVSKLRASLLAAGKTDAEIDALLA